MIERQPRSMCKKSGKYPWVFGISPDFWHTLIILSFFYGLCGLFDRKEITPCPVFLYLSMQFIDVIAHAQQKNPQSYLCFSTKQTFLEFIIIFQYAKCTFHLYGTVHPVPDSCFTQDIFIRFLPLFQKIFRNMQPLASFGFCTFPFIWTPAAVFALMYRHFQFIAALIFLLFDIKRR